MSKRPTDFNGENKDLMALTSINDVSGRYIHKANNKWWAYRIAYEWNLDPRAIKNEWTTEDVMEALAAIGLAERNRPKTPNT